MNEAPAALNTAVARWFAQHGLVIHATHHQFEHDFNAWRHVGEKRVFTLWISELTSDDFEADAIVAMLSHIDPNALMDKHRHVHVHVANNESQFGIYVRGAFSPSADSETPN